MHVCLWYPVLLIFYFIALWIVLTPSLSINVRLSSLQQLSTNIRIFRN
jgi:hypothetical protein